MDISIAPLLTPDERVEVLGYLKAFEAQNPVRVVAAVMTPGDPCRSPRGCIRVAYIFSLDFYDNHTLEEQRRPTNYVKPLDTGRFRNEAVSLDHSEPGNEYGGDCFFGEQIVRSRLLEAHTGVYGHCRVHHLMQQLSRAYFGLPQQGEAGRRYDVAVNHVLGTPIRKRSEEAMAIAAIEARIIQALARMVQKEPALAESPRLLAKTTVKFMRANPELDISKQRFDCPTEVTSSDFALQQLIKNHPGVSILNADQIRHHHGFADSVEVMQDLSLRMLVAEGLGIALKPIDNESEREVFSGG